MADVLSTFIYNPLKKAQRVRPNPSEKQKILPLEGESPEK